MTKLRKITLAGVAILPFILIASISYTIPPILWTIFAFVAFAWAVFFTFVSTWAIVSEHGIQFRNISNGMAAVPIHGENCDECQIQIKTLAMTTQRNLELGARMMDDEYEDDDDY